MDDIWGGYILQLAFPGCVVYGPPTVYQERNEQSVVQNLENEIIGYRNTLSFLRELKGFESVDEFLEADIEYFPKQSLEFYKIYRSQFS